MGCISTPQQGSQGSKGNELQPPQPLRVSIIGWNYFQWNCQLVWAVALPTTLYAAGPCKTLLEYSKVFDFRRSTWHKLLVKTPSSTGKRAPCLRYDIASCISHSTRRLRTQRWRSAHLIYLPVVPAKQNHSRAADEPEKTAISSHRRKNITFVRLIFTRCHSSSCRSCGKG